MSATDKPDPIRGGQYLLDLLAEDEAERLDGLSDAGRLAEAKRAGGDLSRAPSVEEIVARAKAVAAREGRAEVAPAVRVGDTIEDSAPPSRVIPIRRPWRLVGILAAAAVVLFILAAMNRPEIVALPHPGDDNGPLPPTQHEQAEKLRDDAIGSCQQGAWATCKEMLDHAAQIDPAGETAGRVQKARADIAKSTAPAPPKPDKPGL